MNITAALRQLTDRLTAYDFAVHQLIDIEELKICIDKSWTLPFDMNLKNRRTLIEKAHLARFGLKEQTIQDLSIRNTWEIPAERLELLGERWSKVLQSSVADMGARLGLQAEDDLELQLHNLLLYEKGQFFARHQDTEKVPGMQATLVIVLPTKHSGGELVVEKKGEIKSFRLPSLGRDKAMLVLFYADCHHHVKEVRTGNRLALTYNVIVKQ